MRSLKRNRQGLPTLSSTLLRAHLLIAVIAVNLAGLSLMIAGLLALRALEDNNLQLIGRSISYTIEAAVVFNDRSDAEESIARIASTEEVNKVTVLDKNRKVLASWQRSPGPAPHTVKYLASQLLLPPTIVVNIQHEGNIAGQIRMEGNGEGLLRFMLSGLAWMIVCMALSVVSTLYLSRRMFNSITLPLRELGYVAHEVRRKRAFQRRVAPAKIAELNDLADDFNGLLDELEDWEASIQLENKSLAHRATHDSLTGLPNRAFFETQLNQVVQDATARQERFAVLYMDNDKFKEINDNLGHAAGDTVLRVVAERLREQLRKDDLVARLGGDEFAALLTPLQKAGDAQQIANNIAASMQEPILLSNGLSVMTSLSIGIAHYPEDAHDAVGLILVADAAMYNIKNQRRSESESLIPAAPDTNL